MRVAIYTRISRDSEEEGLGVVRQEKDCRTRAVAEGWDVVATYSDNDISASTRSKKPRPQYDAMLAGARAGQIQGVLSYSNSRLTRRPRELEDLIDLCEQHGVVIRTIVSGDDNLATADGRMVARIKANIDAAEAERTAERVQRKMKELAESGRYIGPRPFGWDFVGAGKDRRLVINPAERDALLLTIDDLLRYGGKGPGSVWQLTQRLNGMGLPTGYGNPWVTQVLRRTLLREMNYGMRRHEPGRKTGKAGKAVLYPGQWEPLIDEATHHRIVAILNDPSRVTNNRGTEPRYLLTSVAHCGVCGGYVVGSKGYTYDLKSAGRTRTYPPSYRCHNAACLGVTRRMDLVDYQVAEIVLGVLERDGVEMLGGDTAAADRAQRRIDEIDAKLAIAADHFSAGVIDGNQFARVSATLLPQKVAAKAALSAAQPATIHQEFAGSGARAAWEDADVETRKALLRALGVVITVHRVGAGNGKKVGPDSVTVEWPEAMG